MKEELPVQDEAPEEVPVEETPVEEEAPVEETIQVDFVIANVNTSLNISRLI